MQGMLTVIVPVYNEEEVLPDITPDVIEFCRAKSWPLIFVNDGSRDGSGKYLDAVADTSTIVVLHHKVNRGYGGALKTGISQVKTPFCITLDADGQHNLQDIEGCSKKRGCLLMPIPRNTPACDSRHPVAYA